MLKTAYDYMQTELSIGRRLGPVTATNIYDLQYWCRDYNRRNKFPTPVETVFAIGLYQIHQGMGWQVDTGVNKYESYAAAILHFIRACEILNLDISIELIYDKFDPFHGTTNWRDLLFHISAAQQQFYYAISKTQRGKRRYNKDKLIRHMAMCYLHLIIAIPTEMRTECFYLASKIMTDELK